MRELFSSLLDWYLAALDEGGYLLVGVLMAMESSIIPLPSEFVIPPAAHVAHVNGRMSLTGIVIAARSVRGWVQASCTGRRACSDVRSSCATGATS